MKTFNNSTHRGLGKISAYFFIAAIVLSAAIARGEHGVSDGDIKIGMSNAQSGNAAALGIGVKTGAETYFNKLNAAGGVSGRKINLIAYDDAYEPNKCKGNTQKLLEQDDVFALLGYVGTPTSAAILPILADSDAIYFGPFTGAASLRTPVKKNIYNVRASYGDETDGLVEHLTSDLKLNKIAIFIQDDAYGAAGEKGVSDALKKRNLEVAAKGTYPRNTSDVDGAVDTLKAANPQAVIMVGTYKACAAFVHKCKAAGFNPTFCNISFVGTAAFIKEAGADGEGVFISQVMPSPFDSSIEIVKQYQDDMKAAGHEDLDYTSLEGYIDAVVFTQGLQKAGKELTRASLSSAFESTSGDIGGFKIAFSASDHQASKTVYFTVIKSGKPITVTNFATTNVADVH
jgi:ABC-type branched-subunit amino acid transport system substrate-binding protein